jgi:hypothetical protein
MGASGFADHGADSWQSVPDKARAKPWAWLPYKLGRTIHDLLRRRKPFDMDRFLAA